MPSYVVKMRAYGFITLPDAALTLFLPLASVSK